MNGRRIDVLLQNGGMRPEMAKLFAEELKVDRQSEHQWLKESLESNFAEFKARVARLELVGLMLLIAAAVITVVLSYPK
jgi:hypothetical protein